MIKSFLRNILEYNRANKKTTDWQNIVALKSKSSCLISVQARTRRLIACKGNNEAKVKATRSSLSYKKEKTEKEEKKKMKKRATKLAAMDSCFGLIRPPQDDIANKMAHGLPRRKMQSDASMHGTFDGGMWLR